MKKKFIYLAAMLLALAACDNNGKEPELPPEPVTMKLYDKSLVEIQESIKGKWKWHSSTYYDPNTMATVPFFDYWGYQNITYCTFSKNNVAINYNNGNRTVYNFTWESVLGIDSSSENFILITTTNSNILCNLTEIEKDTLIIHANTTPLDYSFNNSIHKLIRIHK